MSYSVTEKEPTLSASGCWWNYRAMQTKSQKHQRWYRSFLCVCVLSQNVV